MAIADRTCVSCQSAEGKYKCPRCSKYTTQHRDTHPAGEPQTPPPAPVAADDDDDDDDTAHLPAEEQIFIREAKNLFAKYPNLRSQLASIAEATEPPPAEEQEQGGAPAHATGFRKRGDAWTRDEGIQQGLFALHMARQEAADDGVEEYCELVRITNARKADDRLRRDMGRNDALEIERLMHEEQQRGHDKA